MPSADADAVLTALRERRTAKLLAEEPVGRPLPHEQIERLVAAAGLAPFHQPSHRRSRGPATAAPEPWRIRILDTVACRALRADLLADGDTTKLPKLLAAAGACLLVTWLPDPGEEAPDSLTGDRPGFAPTDRNAEHLAATAALIQNLLIAATADELLSYWSSGGALRSSEHLKRLGFPEGAQLLGAVFLAEPATAEAPGVTVAPGKQHAHRSPWTAWASWVDEAG